MRDAPRLVMVATTSEAITDPTLTAMRGSEGVAASVLMLKVHASIVVNPSTLKYQVSIDWFIAKNMKTDLFNSWSRGT